MTTYRHIPTYFNSSSAEDKVSGKLLSTHSLIVPTVESIQRRTSEATAAERFATNMEEQTNALVLGLGAKHDT